MKAGFILVVAIAFVAHDAHAQARSVLSLNWLIGCWERTTRTGRGFEEWRRASDQELVGIARLINASGDRATERLRIYSVRDTLVYDAHPAGQSRTLFPMRSATDRDVVFENLAHDFPKRITYRRVGDDSLVAVVADTATNTRPLTFGFRRSECPPPSAAAVAEARATSTIQSKYDTLVAREARFAGDVNAWMAENGDSAFVLRLWASGGWSVPVITREQMATTAANLRNATTRPILRERRYSVTLDRMLVRGDTVDALVATRTSWYFKDAQGRYGAPGAEHFRQALERRIDTWVLASGMWRLRESAVIGGDVSIDGRPVQRDGVAVPP